MGRRASPVKVEAGSAITRKSRKVDGATGLQLKRRLAEALEQHAAISEILQVISASPSDVQPVLDAVAERAAKLCGAADATILLVEREKLRSAARFRNTAGALKVGELIPLTRGSVTGRAVIDRTVIHVEDLATASEEEFPVGRELQRQLGHHTALSVPLMREDRVTGAIALWRMEARRFTDEQVALVKTFADQAAIAIENVRLFKELGERNRDLTEALEQQTATSDILRVISQSPRDVQPVFDAIAAAALKLCNASSTAVLTFDGELMRLGALANVSPNEADAVRLRYPKPPGRETAGSRAILTGSTVVVPDVLEDPEFEVRARSFRSVVSVPLMHEGSPIGAITVGRPEPGPFPAKQVTLLQTFADQAVIAIENARLFNETKEALEQQKASGEVLATISSSIADTAPVFDKILQSCERLFAGTLVTIHILGEDGLTRIVAHQGPNREAFMASPPAPVTDQRATGLCIRRRTVLHYPDTEDEAVPPGTREGGRLVGTRAAIFAPMLWEGRAIGVIAVCRVAPGPFSDKEIALLKTFADQAVIAIENVRLFTELTHKNHALTQAHAQVSEALDRQTATSEILRVISSSPTDVQPVFETIVANAARVCSAESAAVYRFDGEVVDFVAGYHFSPEALEAYRHLFPCPLRETDHLQRVVDGSVLNIPDIENDPHTTRRTGDAYRARGVRSSIFVPMVREGRAIGAIGVSHREVGAFSDERVELLKTFADQAVIAIENVRLFTELEARTNELTRSVGELKALGEVGQAVSSTLDLGTVLRTIVSRANQLAGMDGGAIFEYDEVREEFSLHATDKLPGELVEALGAAPIPKGEGAIGRLAVTGESVQIRDIVDERGYQSRVRDILIRIGSRSLLAVPLLRENRLLGGLVVNRKSAGEFAPDVIDLLKTFATQSALAIQNARLFREIEVKSRELEAASRHKSEFLANMSHELRTPLNAIIGFSEILSERLFGEINEKQAEYIGDILQSGQHLLSLINDILDLSKIEAGRMELQLSEFDLPSTIENTLTLVRERAVRRGITLGRTVDEHLGTIRADERKVKQVLLNLLSNALKFTPEGGKIDVRVAVSDGVAEISVTDTGVGIAPEDQDAVFEEFRQVGTASRKVEGTGLGLAISRKFIELHGGRIWVRSTVGSGSTFAFTLPLR